MTYPFLINGQKISLDLTRKDFNKLIKIEGVEIEEFYFRSKSDFEKYFEKKYNQPTFAFIYNNINNWISEEKIKVGDFRKRYLDFCKNEEIDDIWILTPKKINLAIREYCFNFKIIFISSKCIRDEYGITHRYHNFYGS